MADTTFRCRMFEVDNTKGAPADVKPKELPPFSLPAKNSDDALRKARKHLRERGRFVRNVSQTHNRNELVCYVFKLKPEDRA